MCKVLSVNRDEMSYMQSGPHPPDLNTEVFHHPNRRSRLSVPGPASTGGEELLGPLSP